MSASKKVQIYQIIRHAQQTNHSWKDPPIRKEQAIPKLYPFDIIIASPYLRTRQTAKLINQENKPIYYYRGISEYQHSEKKHKYKELDRKTEKSATIDEITIPEEETWEDFTARIDKFYRYLLSLEGNILVVTHGIVVKYLQEKLTGSSPYLRARNVPFIGGFAILRTGEKNSYRSITDFDDSESFYTEDQLNKKTVVQLKEILRNKKLKTSGLKKDLITRIIEFFNK